MDNYLNKEGAKKLFDIIVRFVTKALSRKLDRVDALIGVSVDSGTGKLNMMKAASEPNSHTLTQITTFHSILEWGSRRTYGTYKAKSLIYNNMICFQCSESEVVPVANVSTTNTNKTLTTQEFDPFGSIFYYWNSQSATTTANMNISPDRLYDYYHFNIKYCFNISSSSLIINRDVFVRCIPQANGKVKLASSPITQDLPTTEDGFVYILLGHNGDEVYGFLLTINHPVYYYKDGAIRIWTGDAEEFPHDYSKDYLTFDILSDGIIKTNLSGATVSYSKDNGNNWITIGDSEINVTIGDRLLWKSIVFPETSTSTTTSSPVFSGSTASFNASGNIMSLYVEDFVDETVPAASYTSFFSNSPIVSAENLILPATTLTSYCYQRMFQGCTSLTTPPQLPATTLAGGCYFNMFYGCTSLKEAPQLPATTLSINCYVCMFQGCTSLITPPQLPATTLASNCYQSMFQGCTSLTTPPSLPATTLADICYQGMFRDCTSLTTAPQLPATTLANYCYGEMFQGSALTTPPQLPATTLANNCYQGMFSDCHLLVADAFLPATTLANYCYSEMFRNCTSLTMASIDGASIADHCYYRMFYGCTSLKEVTLQTTEAASDSNSYMFCGCRSLKFIHSQLKVVTNSSGSHGSIISPMLSWLTNVSEIGTYVMPDSGVTWTDIGIPTGWQIFTESQWNAVKNYPEDIYIVASTNGVASRSVVQISQIVDSSPRRVYLSYQGRLYSFLGQYDSNSCGWGEVVPDGSVTGFSSPPRMVEILQVGTTLTPQYRSFSNVSISGSYSDLTNRPTIPTVTFRQW